MCSELANMLCIYKSTVPVVLPARCATNRPNLFIISVMSSGPEHYTLAPPVIRGEKKLLVSPSNTRDRTLFKYATRIGLANERTPVYWGG